MKNKTLIFLICLSITLLYSCKSKKEKIIEELRRDYVIVEDVLGDGTAFYSFSISDGNYFDKEEKVKGLFNKHLDTLPKEESILIFSEFCNCLKNVYKWETAEMKILMENEFRTEGVENPFVFCRIWINEK